MQSFKPTAIKKQTYVSNRIILLNFIKIQKSLKGCYSFILGDRVQSRTYECLQTHVKRKSEQQAGPVFHIAMENYIR